MNSEKHQMVNKEPWFAVNLSYFFAGIGQLYAGRSIRGIVLIVSLLILAVTGIWQIFTPSGNIIYGAGFLIASAILYIWNLFDAYEFTRRGNHPSFEQERKSQRDPWLAVFLTQIAPGAGHLYLRENIQGFIFLFLFVIFYAFQGIYIALGVVSIAVSAAAAIHVYFKAPVRRELSLRPLIILIAVMIVYGTGSRMIPFYLKSDVIRNFTTSSNDMAPVIYRGERFFVHQEQPDEYQRGDVLVFELPGDTTWIYLRRLIALPGESVVITPDSSVLVNDTPLRIDGKSITTTPEGQYALPGEPYVVPDGQFFLLAEQPAGSRDSRYFGGITHENIIGHAYKIYWPLNRAGPVK
jgi:signal peptidase I